MVEGNVNMIRDIEKTREKLANANKLIEGRPELLSMKYLRS